MTGGGGVNLGLVSVAGGQKALLYYRGGNLAWGVLSSGATDDFSIGRWNDTGVYQGNALGINRATGAITIPGAVSIAGGVTAAALNNTPIGLTTPSDGAFNILGVVGASYLHGAANGASYANDAAAAAGGIGMHQTYRNGSAVMVRVT
jgi:hypothetical protein